jgi:PAS domain S-box-containing protein
MQSQHESETNGRSKVDQLLWTLSSQAIFSSFSLRVGKITGWNDTDWLGKPLQSFIHPYDIPRIRDRYSEVLAGATVQFESVRCLMRNGSEIKWSLTFVPQIESGIVSKVLVLGHLEETDETGFHKPVSHPLNALRLLSEDDSRPPSTIVEYAGLAKLLEGMLGNAPIAFALLDEDLRIICLNQASSELIGYSPSQQLGQHLRDLLPKLASTLEPTMQNVITTGESVINLEVEFQGSNDFDLMKNAELCLYPIPDLRGGNCGVAVIAVDITGRKRAELALKKTSKELSRSNQALEEFSYIASHDLKEPIRTISTFVQLLQKKNEGSLDKESKEYINYAVDGAKRMQRLIDKILEYSRAGKVERRFTEVSCGAVLNTVIKDLKAALDECGGIISLDSLPTVWGDQTLVLRIFQNLIANAIKYRGSVPPKIHVSARRELNAWVFSIADNGIGIPSDQFVKIFSPFRKLHSQSEYAGSGLGLAICQKNIERLGGKIWVTSEEGQGSIFSFIIPVIPAGVNSLYENSK